MKFRLLSAALTLLFSFSLAAETSSGAKAEAFAGDLFFPVYGASAEAVIRDSRVKRENDIQSGRGNEISQSFLAASGGFFCAKPDLSKFDSDIYSGFGKVQVGNSKLDFSVGAFGVNLPGETKILNKKPRFTLEDGQFAGVLSSATFHFSQNFGVSFSALAANGGFDWGDLYYFYGHPKKTDIYAEKIDFELPFKIDIFALGASIEFKIAADNTEIDANLGHAGANLAVFGAKKRFLGEKEKNHWWLASSQKQSQSRHTLDALAIFAYADFFGSVNATSETQDYFFFPYEKVRGKADGNLFAAGGGFSYKYSRASFEAEIDAAYLHCFSNPSSADYSYQYKKNLFFDGSSDSSDFDIIDFSSCGIFAGKVSLSYNFQKLFHLKKTRPELSFSRIFALPVLTDSARSSLHFSSKSSSSSSSSKLSSSKGLNKLKTVLLAGTLISFKIEY